MFLLFNIYILAVSLGYYLLPLRCTYTMCFEDLIVTMGMFLLLLEYVSVLDFSIFIFVL